MNSGQCGYVNHIHLKVIMSLLVKITQVYTDPEPQSLPQRQLFWGPLHVRVHTVSRPLPFAPSTLRLA